ncbi:MAG TPA: hypothetical protein VGW75_07885 [Solirubrobacteraceae bacterium]|nr:hypothetical protein [Solirubrobacteraceae bacterium]
MTEHRLLSAEEAGEVESTLRELRSEWVPRSKGPSGEDAFFTLACSTYLDVCYSQEPERDYYARYEAGNAVLREHFGDLLERTRALLAETLGEPVEYAPHLALPGFHVWTSDLLPGTRSSPPHFDSQYQALRWPEAQRADGAISFTLPIAVPSSGSGLDTWNLEPADYERMARRGLTDHFDRFKDRKVMTSYRYEPGRLVLQHGLVLHRISGSGEGGPDDRRVTFQGHGLRIDGTWRLYW